jgi:hypothetical protein
MPVFLSIQEPFAVNSYAELHRLAWGFKTKFKGLRQNLIRKGYDGIEITESTTDGGGSRIDFVVFEPTQIKSATGNNGNFEPNDPDITH